MMAFDVGPHSPVELIENLWTDVPVWDVHSCRHGIPKAARRHVRVACA
jgi:hypothetical protein